MSGASCEGRRGLAHTRGRRCRSRRGWRPAVQAPKSTPSCSLLDPMRPAPGGYAMNVRLYFLQRASAAIMAPLVLVHLALIYYAIRGGLSAAEILARTRGSIGWGAFYGLFVLAAATHGAIGVRTIASEWAGIRGDKLDLLLWGFGLRLAALGLRAMAAVLLP